MQREKNRKKIKIRERKKRSQKKKKTRKKSSDKGIKWKKWHKSENWWLDDEVGLCH